jgi:Ni/Co efflux regulator RcnB
MKKLIIAALAASVAASPVLAAPWSNNGHDRNGRYEQRHDNRGGYDRHDRNDRSDRYERSQYRKWNKGQRFDSRYARNYRVISGPSRYHLRPAPRGYRWVQSGNDAVMVGITTGIIAAVLANAIN